MSLQHVYKLTFCMFEKFVIYQFIKMSSLEEIKAILETYLDTYINRLIVIQQCLIKKSTIQMEKDRIKCPTRWYAGPDKITILLKQGLVDKLVHNLITEGQLNNIVKIGLSWRKYSTALEVNNGEIHWCYSSEVIDEYKLDDNDVELAEGDVIKQEIMKSDGIIYSRVKGKIIESKADSESQSSDSESESSESESMDSIESESQSSNSGEFNKSK